MRSIAKAISRPQFSLRLLLLLVTLFAIGFPIWYRWPYEITDHPGGGTTTRTTTYQRQWGGKAILHGPQVVKQVRMTQTFMYRQGKLHGPYACKVNDRYVQRGQYLDDLKEGDWIEGDGQTATITHWLHGQLHGSMTFKNNRGHALTAGFDHGRLVQVNGKPLSGSIDDVFKSRDVDPIFRAELDRQTEIDIVEFPLQDVVLFLSVKHVIPIVIDPKTIAVPSVTVTASLRGTDLRSTLSILLALHDLTCDYRYGCLWITTPDDIATWTDHTGVAEIPPPPDSHLARVWNEPVKIDLQQSSLQTALDVLKRQLAIQIDASSLPSADDPSRYPVTLHFSGLPFRHVLGQLLNQANCHCDLDHEILVVKPLPAAAPKTAKTPPPTN